MFKAKIKIKEELVPKVGMYITDRVESNAYKVVEITKDFVVFAWYDESKKIIDKNKVGHALEIWRKNIKDGTWKIINDSKLIHKILL